MSFPTFNGAAGEDAQEFLDNLEIACLVIGRDDDATRLRVFPLLMKAEAKAWFNTLLPANIGDCAGLRVLFLAKFGGGGETSESLWSKVCELRQGSLFEYNVYELQFVELWERWVASLRLGEAAPDFLKKDRLVKVEEEEKGKSLPKNKGKSKMEDVDAMPIKRARQEEVAMSETCERRKSKENGESSSKKKSKPRRKLTIKDFALGESSQPYNLVDDVSVQGPKITWPQLLHLAPKVCRQWTKMVSTRRVKTKAMGLVSGAQICVMTEQTMHRLGIKVNAPAPCKAKMANISKVKCLGVINALKIKVCEIEVEVDVYVMPTKGEGYPIILGRPWLMAMQARQDWGTGMLELQPHKGAKKGKAIHIDLRGGKHESLDLEISVDEFSSSDYSTSEEESTITDESDISQAEIMGVVLTNPTMPPACYEEKIKPSSPQVDQEKEVVLLGEAHSPYLDGVYTLKLDKAAIGIAIYNEKGVKLFSMNLVVEGRSLFIDALYLAKQVDVASLCGNQNLMTKAWRGVEFMKDFTRIQPPPAKENHEADTSVGKQVSDNTTKAKMVQSPLSQEKERWLDTLHLLKKAFPNDPNKRRRWLIRKATRYKKWPKILLEA
ncbi:hypothetical protein L7F22_002278 [Adiantum nelumboides]|nr:hypothetical protein [Adiantum nelumboides]